MSESPPPSFVRALAAHKAGAWAAAERFYEETIAQFPGAFPAHHNLVTVLNAQSRWAEAERALRRALGRWPTHPTLRFNLGLSRLAAGDYAEGLPLYEHRRDAERDRVLAPVLSFPEWNGEPVESLLLLPEQGLGDQIQFARYVPLLRAQGIRVTLACSPSLRRLFEPLGVSLIEAVGNTAFSRHDAWALLGSLPLRFGARVATVPPPAPICTRPGLGQGRGIGVGVRGNPSHHNDENRSLPRDMAELLLSQPSALSLLPEDTGARDFQDTAELIAGLDRVITVDTSIAHLAASMGKPTWILLPKIKCDWRWGREGDQSTWYQSARLFRQRAPGDWRGVLEDVQTALRLS